MFVHGEQVDFAANVKGKGVNEGAASSSLTHVMLTDLIERM
jgi:hypothetical protein